MSGKPQGDLGGWPTLGLTCALTNNSMQPLVPCQDECTATNQNDTRTMSDNYVSFFFVFVRFVSFLNFSYMLLRVNVRF